MMDRIFFLASGFFFLGLSQSQAQLVIGNTQTPEQLVQNVLVGGGVVISNVTFNGVAGSALNEQIGSFNGENCNIGIPAGVILATGDVNNALGPNNSGSSSLGGGNFGAGDPDLAELSGQDINDAAILEFDFVPTGDSLKFNFVFASEEYLEFVNSINDAFGFFLSGPGISGPFANNGINIALVPGTTTPVTINNVNDVVNPAYYIDNGTGDNAPYNGSTTYVQYDGFTVVMTALAHVTCGSTYHIKIVIGDASDTAWDSAVFLQAGSFASNTLPALSAATVTGDGIVDEGCEGSVFVVNRPAGVDSTITISYFLSGTATAGVDYSALPNPIIIPEGQDSVAYDLQPVEDNSVEGNETVILTVYAVNSCGDSISASTTITIADYVPVQIITETPIQLHCDQDSVLLSASVTGGYGEVTFYWDAGQPSSQLWIPGHEDGDYTVTAMDQCPTRSTRAVIVDSGCEIIVPNVLTPNGDGDNEIFVIKGILGKDNQVKIYDRWGKEVFSTRNYRNSFRASDLNDGVYFYTVEVEDKIYTGNLTVLGSK